MMTERLDPAFWDGRYRDGHTPWDLGTPAPAFVRAVQEGRFELGRLLIPGCGQGHEAVYLARHGFRVTACDISPRACGAAARLAAARRAPVRLECLDFFALPPSYRRGFDYVMEQTFFCAIDPVLRPDYVRVAAEVLRPGGRLFGLFFDIPDDDGPPFGTDAAELRRLFSGPFEVELLKPCEDSHPRRAGEELWVEMRRMPG